MNRVLLILFTYLIFYLYCVACVILVLWKGKRVAPEIRHILFAFPVIAAAVIVIQYLNPHIILSGSAATCAMLLIYLYLQNKQSCIDYLTGIPNRHEFLKMLEVYTRKKYTFTILVVSLREFKLVNDTYGQHNGDALLACVSGFLKKDLSLHEGEIYRYSGDEFALLLKNATKPSVQALTLKLLHRMQTPWTAGSCTCMLSAAIGLVSCPNSSDEMEGLVNGLEISRIYGQKGQGKL